MIRRALDAWLDWLQWRRWHRWQDREVRDQFRGDL